MELNELIRECWRVGCEFFDFIRKADSLHISVRMTEHDYVLTLSTIDSRMHKYHTEFQQEL